MILITPCAGEQWPENIYHRSYCRVAREARQAGFSGIIGRTVVDLLCLNGWKSRNAESCCGPRMLWNRSARLEGTRKRYEIIAALTGRLRRRGTRLCGTVTAQTGIFAPGV